MNKKLSNLDEQRLNRKAGTTPEDQMDFLKSRADELKGQVNRHKWTDRPRTNTAMATLEEAKGEEFENRISQPLTSTLVLDDNEIENQEPIPDDDNLNSF